MPKRIKVQKVELDEIRSYQAGELRPTIKAYRAAVQGGDVDGFSMVTILPPTGFEFADLTLLTQIQIDCSPRNVPVSPATERALRGILRKVPGMKEMYPNEGLPIHAFPSIIEFVAPDPIADILFNAFEDAHNTLGRLALAPAGSHKTEFPKTRWGNEIYEAFTYDYDYEGKPERTLEVALNFYDRLLSRPASKRFVPNEMRYLMTGTSIIRDPMEIYGIDKVMLVRAAIVKEMADPCFFSGLETDLHMARSSIGKSGKVLSRAKKVRLSEWPDLRWEELVVEYLAGMRKDYPCFWNRLPGVEDERWMPLSWESTNRKK
jgi:hypothetical protein